MRSLRVKDISHRPRPACGGLEVLRTGGPHVRPPYRQSGLVAGIDLKALAVLRDRRVALRSGFQSAEPAQWAAESVATNVVERPHLLCIEAQVGLRDESLPVIADKAKVLNGVGDVPSVVAVFPLAATAEATHRRRRAPFIFGGESHLMRPAATFRAISVHLAVDFVANEVLADQTRNHAAPAAVRIDVAHVAVEENLQFAWLGQFGVPLPVVAEFSVPARILMLEPLEVLLGLRLDAPEIDRPADRKELRGQMDVVFLDDPIPGRRHVVVVDLDAVF